MIVYDLPIQSLSTVSVFAPYISSFDRLVLYTVTVIYNRLTGLRNTVKFSGVQPGKDCIGPLTIKYALHKTLSG